MRASVILSYYKETNTIRTTPIFLGVYLGLCMYKNLSIRALELFRSKLTICN